MNWVRLETNARSLVHGYGWHEAGIEAVKERVPRKPPINPNQDGAKSLERTSTQKHS